MATNTWAILPNRSTATLIVAAGQGPTLVTNLDLNNTVYLGDDDTIKSSDAQGVVPLGPNGSVVVNGQSDLFAVNGNAATVKIATLTGGLNNFLGLTQGGGILAISGIQSPNFGPGIGWQILQNGQATFNSITLPAGAGGATVFVQGTTPSANHANDVWINTANNNEILTATAPGTANWVANQFGTNAILPGSITAALLVAGIVVAGIIDGTTVTAATFNGSTYNGTDFKFNPSGLFFYSGTPALGNLVLTIGVTTSGTDSFGNAYQAGNAVLYQSSTAFTSLNASSAGNLILAAGSSGGAGLELPSQSTTPTSSTSILYADTAGNLSYRNGSGGFNGHLVNALNADTTPRGVSGPTQTQLSAAFIIPANDARAGNIYRLVIYGKFTQATTAEQTSVNGALNGTAVAASGWVAATVGSGLGATWKAEFTLLILTTGVSGTATAHLTGLVSTNGRAAQTAAQPFGAYSTNNITINTTVNNTMTITGNTVTSANIAGIGSTLERLGV